MFARVWPGLLEPATGQPRTWRHFIYGLREMPAVQARESLVLAGVAKLPHMDKAGQDQWYAEQRRAAGWNTDG